MIHIRNTTMLDFRIKEDLKQWKSIIKKYEIPSYKKASIQLINSFLPFVALWILMYVGLSISIYITLGLGVINAFFMVRIFIIQHDTGHQSFTRSKTLNNVIGQLCSIATNIPYKYWAKSHNYHHGHSGQLDIPTREVGDIPTKTVSEYMQIGKWKKLGYRIFRSPIVTFVVAPIYYFIVSCRVPSFAWSIWKKRFWYFIKICILDNILIFSSYSIAWYLLGWKFIFIHGYIVLLFGIIAFWFFYVQHQHEFGFKQWKNNWDYLLSAIKGATYYKLPKVLQWLTGNIGIHHIHHLSSLIPNYNLEKCMRENPKLTKYVTVVTLKESFTMTRNKLWDENTQRMISFKECASLYGT